MRVIHTPPRYAPHIGGVEVVDQVLAEYAAARGHDVFVVTADVPRGAPGKVNGVAVRRLPWRLKLANTNLTPGLPRVLWRADWDVVHTHLPTPWTADVSVLIAFLRRRRSVLHFHNPIVGTSPVSSLVAWLYRNSVQRLTFRLTDAVIAISPTRRELLLQAHPGIAAKLHLVPNGVDLERYAPPVSRPAGNDVLFVSVLDEFHEYKGLSVLLAALVEVPSARLRIVGDGALRDRWVAETRTLGVADRVVFEGAVSTPALHELYRSCAVFCLPSQRIEQEGGSSLVALEAMACGLPVVLADGVGDLAAQAEAAGAGLAVRSGDAAGLAAALNTLLDDATARREAGQRARRHVEQHHSWDVAAARIVALYRTA